MTERAYVDASPLIHLAKADLLALLQPAATTVVVPASVWREVAAVRDLAAEALASLPWLRIASEDPHVPPEVDGWNLGLGESSVLAHALREQWLAILDDRMGRRCAAVIGVRYTGTLGLVLRAKKQGSIPSARTLVCRLVEAGMYLSDETVDRAVALVGE